MGDGFSRSTVLRLNFSVTALFSRTNRDWSYRSRDVVSESLSAGDLIGTRRTTRKLVSNYPQLKVEVSTQTLHSVRLLECIFPIRKSLITVEMTY